jgi:uncharacterized protein (TIGR03089 family)
VVSCARFPKLATPYRLWVRDDEILPATIPAAFAAATAVDPGRPLLTWYDDGTGERAELSGATCANWLAKTANLLVDGCGLGTGDVAVVDAPPHWQTAVILLGCWSAGLRVADPAAGIDADVVFSTPEQATGYSGEVFGLALAPLAAPMRDAPPGVADYVIEVRAHGDHFTPASPVLPDTPAVTPAASLASLDRSEAAIPAASLASLDRSDASDLSHRDLCRHAAARADALGIRPGARVLVDVAAYPDPLDWLLAPLLAGASVVLCGHLDPAAVPTRIAAERVTLTL